MKPAVQLTDQKLRGGFYTPMALVLHCLDRVSALNGHESMEVLEPSAGDGAFIRGLLNHGISTSIENVVAVELNQDEASRCANEVSSAPFGARVCAESFLEWFLSNDKEFELAIGNPPFVRYQFIDETETKRIGEVGSQLGISFRGVSNLWIPILLAALSRLKPAGTMAFVVPAELFTGVSAGVARSWLLANFSDLRVDLFDSGSFPDVLQEVIVVSGRRLRVSMAANAPTTIDFVDHCPFGQMAWRHRVAISSSNWTRYLLDERQLEKVEIGRHLPGVLKLGDVAQIEVSTVTGANAFFSLSSAEVASWRLAEWTLPLLSRARHATGIEYSTADHHEATRTSVKAWFLYFDSRLRDPIHDVFAAAYLAKGEHEELHRRYKTSIREPWYRVPLVRPGRLMLSKRCHTFPRLILNSAGVVTTDTVYQGNTLPILGDCARDLVAGFHNSITLLDAELEGRSFGGGVLELVPSEIARISVPLVRGFASHFEELDVAYRRFSAGQAEELEIIDRTNQELANTVAGLTKNLLTDLEESRLLLQRRRLERNR